MDRDQIHVPVVNAPIHFKTPENVQTKQEILHHISTEKNAEEDITRSFLKSHLNQFIFFYIVFIVLVLYIKQHMDISYLRGRLDALSMIQPHRT